MGGRGVAAVTEIVTARVARAVAMAMVAATMAMAAAGRGANAFASLLLASLQRQQHQ